MGKRLILQVGRVGKNINEEITFAHESDKYSAHLSSLAWQKHWQGKGWETEVVLFYPVSCVFNTSLKWKDGEKEKYPEGDYKAFIQSINDVLSNEDKQKAYLKNPQEILQQHPHNKLASGFQILHSVGTYLQKDSFKGYEFKTSLQDLVLVLWSFLIDKYLAQPFDELYVDISTGVNFYSAAFVEAVRYFTVWTRMFHCSFGTQNPLPKSFLCYSDPILESGNTSFSLYTYEVKHKAFFSSPVSKNDCNKEQGLPKQVIERALRGDTELIQNVITCMEDFLVIFSCFKEGTPLMLYSEDFTSRDKCGREKDCLRTLVGKILSRYKENWVASPDFRFFDFAKVLLSLGFLRGLRHFMADNGIEKKAYINLAELEKFKEILSKLNLNLESKLLGAEISSNFKKKEFKEALENDWKMLREYFPMNEKAELNKRNFFAHAGFEKTITMVKKEGDSVAIKYSFVGQEEDSNHNSIKENVLKILKENAQGE